ncbi:MAG TPA: ABC transporter permease [Thermoanaerobaculales bacterium]|nr:ABC transporter permease [Thermoanaerobaculales bacterium]HPA80123.1 ABC transporter permease [Thermoanaerobaculales bacterium]HQL30579.1 ABC transporter permease [Thermoanaerobaculales bacterium]HQN95874.1 ABC transporter permease [Thermoanaerobaculales bacterium]HQP43932.1 ABC transporter permease [Thermoanaerobaculales bacterium]
MSLRPSLRLALLELRRGWRRLAAAGIGIALAVASLVFLLALGLGLRATLLGEVLPLDRLEVAREATSLDLFGVRLPLGGDTLDSAAIERLQQIPGVRRVFPKMKLTVPAVASAGGWLLGSALQTELVVDGIDPGLVADEVGAAFQVTARALPAACADDRDCGDDAWCVPAGGPGAGSCRPYVPALVSHHLLELYNGSLRRVYHLPQLNPDKLIGATAELTVGASMVRGDAWGVAAQERVRLVGFSDRAIAFGLTLPLEVVRDLNARFSSSPAADAFHSAVLQLESPGSGAAVIAAVEELGLAVTDRGARRTAGLLALLMAIAALVGAAVLAVAATAVAHAFFIGVSGRRREIAVLRAIGATRGDIRGSVVTEAAAVGLAAGVLGVAAAAAGALLVDRLAVSWIADLPYRPDSLFRIEPWLVAGGLAVAIVAAVLGALPGARRSAARDPADTLSGP